MKKILFLTTCFFLITTGMAQLPSEVKVGKPTVLTSKLLKEKDIESVRSSNNWGQNNKSNSFWIVWSDRDDNTTYEAPNYSSAKKSHLDFNQRVRIAEIQNDFAHVYVEGQESAQYPRIQEGTDKGWVPMSNLLWWGRCPANERGILNKALIVANLSEKESDKKNVFRVYRDPNRKIEWGYATSSINFRFVMKEDKETGMVLLANEANLQAQSNDQLLYGWLNKDSYVKWNQRSCLEPNWEEKEVDHFKHKGDLLKCYENADFSGELITKFKYGSITNKDGRDIDHYRMPKGALRYPILDKNDKTDNNVYYCNVFASNGKLTDAAQYNEQMVNKMNNAVRDAESVNLIIAIDGTRSMENFYRPVKDAIKSGYETFKNQGCDVKVGIVIYRDYKDGQYVTEVLPLQKHNNPRIGQFLDNGGDGKYGIKSAPGDDVPEALFEGLKVATDKVKMGFGEKESNLLLVVGDCGNRVNDKQSPTQEEITRRLIDNQFQVVAFQVRRMNQPAYNWFHDQMCKIIKDNITEQTKGMNLVEDIGWKRSSDGYELKAGYANRFYIGSLLYPKLGEDMNLSRLSYFITETLHKYSNAIRDGKEVYNNPWANAKDSSQAKFNEEWLIKKRGKEYADFMKKTNSIMSSSAYAPRKNADGHDYWKTVVYISSEELNQLLNDLRGVYQAAKTADFTNREPYVTAFKGVVKTMIPEKSEQDMDAMSQEEIMAEIAGLNVRTETTKKFTLQQLLNPKVVDDATYADILKKFERKYDNLNRLKASNYPFKLVVRNNTYYWLPTEMIP
jgi:hypothetical protein